MNRTRPLSGADSGARVTLPSPLNEEPAGSVSVYSAPVVSAFGAGTTTAHDGRGTGPSHARTVSATLAPPASAVRARACCSRAGSTGAPNERTISPSGGTSCAPGASGWNDDDHLLLVSAAAVADATRLTRIESDGVWKVHDCVDSDESATPVYDARPGFSESVRSRARRPRRRRVEARDRGGDPAEAAGHGRIERERDGVVLGAEVGAERDGGE